MPIGLSFQQLSHSSSSPVSRSTLPDTRQTTQSRTPPCRSPHWKQTSGCGRPLWCWGRTAQGRKAPACSCTSLHCSRSGAGSVGKWPSSRRTGTAGWSQSGWCTRGGPGGWGWSTGPWGSCGRSWARRRRWPARWRGRGGSRWGLGPPRSRRQQKWTPLV